MTIIAIGSDAGGSLSYVDIAERANVVSREAAAEQAPVDHTVAVAIVVRAAWRRAPNEMSVLDEEHQLRRWRHGLLLAVVATASRGHNGPRDRRPLGIPVLEPKQGQGDDAAGALQIANLGHLGVVDRQAVRHEPRRPWFRAEGGAGACWIPANVEPLLVERDVRRPPRQTAPSVTEESRRRC